MYAKENLGDYYADTAYTPTKRQQWEAANSERDTVVGSRLSWVRQTQDNAMEEDYDFSHLEISEKEDRRCLENNAKGDEVYRLLKMRYDHQAIMPPNYKSSARYFFVSMALGKVVSYLSVIAFIFFLIVYALFLAFGNIDSKRYLEIVKVFFVLLFPCFIVSFFIWKGGEWVNRKKDLAFRTRKGPLWQLNRQTGLFTIYDPKNAWNTRLEAPFWEFDAFLQSSPDTQGSATYSLILYHPFQRIRQKLDAQFPPTKMPGELVAAWQFLQRYMDVSQPLPDVPGLEIHRHKDPTTAAADQQQGRNPRYWRDMDEASVKKIQEEKYRKNIRLR
ncbi:hypothetical protein ACUY1T_09640 [Billgrantia sp. Q4P2]|uniref:hypothetical protein n=1 Tax=Billgrantia sp. Q4P2 TaxID=3463857 RepID=UPI004057C568